VLRSPLLPLDLASSYAMLSEQLLSRIAAEIASLPTASIRLHGDCHLGNILWTDRGPHFVDLDDCRNGPAIQDLWMLLSGDRAERTLQLDALLDGYRTFADLDPAQVALIEPLRGLRMVHYNGWLARRWNDPAFPAAFPWAESTHYWAQHVEDLRQQLAVLDEPPLPFL
jgi:Ser/Thr protein kinase RdoA (MazF antagonist)